MTLAPAPRLFSTDHAARATRATQIASVALLMGLVACGGGDDTSGDVATAPTVVAPSPTPPAPTPPAPTPPAPTPPAPTPAAPAPPPPATPGSWWTPALSDSWQIQLTGTLGPTAGIRVHDIDLFDTTAAAMASIKAQGGRVVCYFSAGSSENWRSDFSRFQAADMGNNLDGWPGERWLDTRSDNARAIMGSRLDLAVTKGCDAVDPDNVDGYTNNTGKPLTAATQLDYNRWLATQAHQRGLAIGLKNDVDQLSQLADSHDFAVNEQCHQYNECGGYTAFTALGKPVFNIEYAKKYVSNTGGAFDLMCSQSAALGVSSQVLPLALDGSFRQPCP